MLVLSRKNGERIHIADNIEVTVISVGGGRVRLGFNAPTGVPIHRAEVLQRMNQKPGKACPTAKPPVSSTIEGAPTCP